MDVIRLRYIVAIAHYGSMTQTAKLTFTTQSSLSQYVAKLETELGTPIFYRNHGKLTLTPAGELYVDAVNEVIRIHDELYSRIQNHQYKRHIRVGITTHFGLTMMDTILPILKKECPDLIVEVIEGNIPSTASLLNEGKLDCAIMALTNPKFFISEKVHVLQEEEIFFLVPNAHPFVKAHPSDRITLTQLKENFSGTSFILSRKGSTLREISERIFAKMHLPINTVCEANNVSLIQNMVAKNIGVSILSETNVVKNPLISYYSFNPKIYRLDCFVERDSWLKTPLELRFEELVLNFFSSSKNKKESS